jgi:glucose/arabinose dehydrogenase
MKHILITTIAAAVLVGCGETQQSSPPEAQPAEPASEAPAQLSSPPPEAKPAEPIEPVEPVAKAAQPAQDAEAAKQEANRALMTAARDGNIEAIKQQLAAGADVNAIDDEGLTPMDRFGDEETAALLYKHGAKRARDLKAEGK